MNKNNQPHSACIYLLRHGEPVGGSCYRGSSDDPLSELGWQQMHDAIESNLGWQSIVSSPLQRCSLFAQKLSHSLDLPWHQENQFAEIHFGDWEGKTATELWQHDHDNFSHYLLDPLNHSPPNGETLQLFSHRVLLAWDKLVSNTQPHDNILLIAHGGTIRVILHHLLGMPLRSLMKIHVPLACMSKIILDYTDPTSQCRLAFHNQRNNRKNTQK